MYLTLWISGRRIFNLSSNTTIRRHIQRHVRPRGRRLSPCRLSVNDFAAARNRMLDLGFINARELWADDVNAAISIPATSTAASPKFMEIPHIFWASRPTKTAKNQQPGDSDYVQDITVFMEEIRLSLRPLRELPHSSMLSFKRIGTK